MGGWYLVNPVCLGRFYLLVPYLGASALLLLFVTIGPRIPLAQLLLQVMVLLSKAFLS